MRPGLTGLLAPCEDEQALADAISELLNDEAIRAEMSLNCRRLAVQEYSRELHAKRYAALYERVKMRLAQTS